MVVRSGDNLWPKPSTTTIVDLLFLSDKVVADSVNDEVVVIKDILSKSCGYIDRDKIERNINGTNTLGCGEREIN